METTEAGEAAGSDLAFFLGASLPEEAASAVGLAPEGSREGGAEEAFMPCKVSRPALASALEAPGVPGVAGVAGRKERAVEDGGARAAEGAAEPAGAV